MLKQTTWFTKGLRQCGKCNCFAVRTSLTKQTTWFTKGLRPALNLRLPVRHCQWNKRPDLRRDCDLRSLHSSIPNTMSWETNDLIYEGIATAFGVCSFSLNLNAQKQTTWFTKGLRQQCWITDCWNLRWKQTTWFTKGLRHCKSLVKCLLTRFKAWNKRPDLRRDCDCSFFFSLSICIMLMKQTTWFTKGLRLWASSSRLLRVQSSFRNKRPDLRRDCDLFFV